MGLGNTGDPTLRGVAALTFASGRKQRWVSEGRTVPFAPAGQRNLTGREGALLRGASPGAKGREVGVNLATPAKLGRLQEVLNTKAKQEPDYRFYLLYDKVYRVDLLVSCLCAQPAARGERRV